MKHRIIIADDHEIILDGLRRILEPEFEIVASATDGRTLLSAIENLKPAVAVVDISMPLLNGLDALRQSKGARFSTHASMATQAFRLGAAGYVVKQAAARELVTAIHEAIAGHTYITPRIAHEVLQNLIVHPTEDTTDASGLTGREREVLQLLAEGKIAKEISAILKVSPRTIEFHKNNIMVKTGLHSTAELARYAARTGLVSEES
jgi:DNA-binding NarL/FixJ family response regulator